MSINKQKKTLEIKEMEDFISKSSAIVVWNYEGTSAEEFSKLRKDVRNSSGLNKIYKNSLAEIAFKNKGKEEILGELKNSSSFLFTFDNTDSLKVLFDLISKNKKLSFKAGYVDGVYYDANKIKEIAGLPSKNVLLSMLLTALQGNIRNLAYSLSQIASKKEGENS